MNGEKLRIGVVGCGGFAKSFVPLFQNHPNTEFVCVTDLLEERAQDYAQRFGVSVIPTYEDMLRSDVNCIAVFTQRHLHGPHVLAALRAGKHVYSAVPMASTVAECREILRLCEEKRLVYMMGETCYYYPCAMYCREQYRAGKLGKFVYGASQYYHDIAEFHFLNKTEGYLWRRIAGLPPMFYPTHSFGMILSALDTHVTRLSCFGYRDTEDDHIYGDKSVNDWANPYSNMIALTQLANGGTARVSECRRIGWFKPSSFISNMYGTEGGYEYSNAQHIFVERKGSGPARLIDASDRVNPAEMTQHKADPDFKEQVANAAWSWSSTAPIQDISRLPAAYEGLPTGHMGTHKLLVDDFCRAAYEGRLPIISAWEAARYTLPGLIAVESANQGGILMEVPDYGDAPADWERIRFE